MPLSSKTCPGWGGTSFKQGCFQYYSSGMGLKVIARKLNESGRKTPKQLRDERNGKAEGKTYLWTYQSVHNILSDISYTGVLINHKTETKGRRYTYVPEDGWFCHEGFFPVIIEREEWELVQLRLKGSVRPYSGNKRTHRYAGLLRCGDCGSTFIPKIRRWMLPMCATAICTTVRTTALLTPSGRRSWMLR